MQPLAKSSLKFITLAAHTAHVREEAGRLLDARPFASFKYHQRTERDLRALVDKAALWHDEGKKHPKWQKACELDYEESLRLGRNSGANLRCAGIRHEMASLQFMVEAKTSTPLCVWAAVAAHHAKLSRYHEKRWHDEPGFEAFWKQFVKAGSTLNHTERSSFEESLAKRYEFAGPRAILQLADHRASAAEDDDALPTLKSFDYKFPHETKRGVQQIITELWDEPLAILRAPTGAGKTDAALLWAQHQIDKNRADRLIIAMPTRFTANALAINVTDTLSARGLYHSSAWHEKLKENPDKDWEKKKFQDKELNLARLLETPVTVTTLDHLCICLTGHREDHHGIFWGLAHSCVVIDEADFYDDFTQYNAVTLLRALRFLKVPVLLMSATVPDSARTLYAQSGHTISKTHEDETKLDVLRCQLTRKGAVLKPEDVKDILERGLNGEPLIIYANTVKRAQEYRRWFKEQEFHDVILYHSRFTEPHKAEIETHLSKMLGREAWKNQTQFGVAILTQIGELSVNISADLMISDLCPIDRLAQRVGRLSRFRDEPGELFLVEPQRMEKDGETHYYPAPYGHFSGGKWEITPTLEKSRDWLQDGEYSAQRFVTLVNELYKEESRITPKARDNQKELEKSAVINWLIVPRAEIAEDADQTHKWKSRDIPLQKTVFADCEFSTIITNEEDTQTFPTWGKFRECELRHGISIYDYEFKQASKSGTLEKVTVFIGRDDKDTEEIYVVRSKCYDTVFGLRLTPEGDEGESR